MLFEIINPSDPYTLEADPEDFLLAAIGVLFLGAGQYGLKAISPRHSDSSLELPLFPLGGHDEWLRQRGVEKDALSFFLDNRLRVAEILDSVLIGSARERAHLQETLSLISCESDRERVRAAHHEMRRSSLNDIGEAAKVLASRARSYQDRKSDDGQHILSGGVE